MTQLAYMIRSDWGQDGTAMIPQSAVIREWLGNAPYAFMVADVAAINTARPADLEYINFIEPDASQRRVFSFSALREFAQAGASLDHAITLVHPYREGDCELLREVIQTGRIARLFVIVWSRSEAVRVLLDGLGALNLHTGETAPLVDPVQLEAARSMVDEQYNGLGSGYGKDVVVQLLRAVTEAGYPLEEETWVRAFYAAGGDFGEAQKVAKLIREMQQGVQHRVKQRLVPDIVEVLRAQVAEKAAAS